MKAINLHAWAGLDFSFAPGALVELPKATVEARIELGLMREATPDELASLTAASIPSQEPEAPEPAPEEAQAPAAAPAQTPAEAAPRAKKKRA